MLDFNLVDTLARGKPAEHREISDLGEGEATCSFAKQRVATFSSMCRLSLLLIISLQLLDRNDRDIKQNALLSKKIVSLATKIETIFGSPRKKSFYTSRIVYYAASTASFQLQCITLSGDVNPNPGPTISQNHHGDEIHIIAGNGLKIGQWNVNNLTDNKLEQIKLLLSPNDKIDLLFLIETFLTSKKPDSLPAINGYNMTRRDRTGSQKGGGLLAHVSENLKSRLPELKVWKMKLSKRSGCR